MSIDKSFEHDPHVKKSQPNLLQESSFLKESIILSLFYIYYIITTCFEQVHNIVSQFPITQFFSFVQFQNIWF